MKDYSKLFYMCLNQGVVDENSVREKNEKLSLVRFQNVVHNALKDSANGIVGYLKASFKYVFSFHANLVVAVPKLSSGCFLVPSNSSSISLIVGI